MIERVIQLKLICDNCKKEILMNVPSNFIIELPKDWTPRTVNIDWTSPPTLNCGKCKTK